MKAVHLEPVSDLSTKGFLSALRRFVFQRGQPKQIYTDHGTNFVGAAMELKAMYDLITKSVVQDTITDLSTSKEIEWKFELRWLWEAAMKAMKKNIKGIAGETQFTSKNLSQYVKSSL